MRPASISRFPTNETDVTQNEEEKVASYRPFPGALSPLRTPPATATTLLERTDSPNQLSPQDSSTWRDEWVRMYDKWYHWLKKRSWWVVAFVLATTVASSIAIGWSFRLKTFNIADGSEAGDSAVSRHLSVHVSVMHPYSNNTNRFNCLPTLWTSMQQVNS